MLLALAFFPATKDLRVVKKSHINRRLRGPNYNLRVIIVHNLIIDIWLEHRSILSQDILATLAEMLLTGFISRRF